MSLPRSFLNMPGSESKTADFHLPEVFELDLRLPTNEEVQGYARDLSLQRFYMREVYCEKYSYALLTKDFIEDLAMIIGAETAIEVGAGAGWLSYWLRQHGANMVSTTDDMSWKKKEKRIYAPGVEQEDAVSAVLDNRTSFVLLCWPYMDDMAERVWKALTPGQKLIYIGETNGGCCANDNFFQMVGNMDWDNRVKSLVQWDGIHDICCVEPCGLESPLY